MISSLRHQARHGDWSSAATRVALLGDSTLDNVLWIGEQDPSISEQIVLGGDGRCAVSNLAADGYTSADTLHGSRRVISMGLRREIGDPVSFDSDGVFRPLAQVAALSPPPTHIVLSVGGNDVREILGDMGRLPEVLAGFAKNYPQILEACLRVTPNVLLMLQYRPSWHMDGGGYGVYQAIGAGTPGPGDPVAKLNQLMEAVYAPVLALARLKRLPLIDLPRTFDIYRDEIYKCQIEPSALGGAIIAELVNHAVADAPGSEPSSSKLYTYKPCVPGQGTVVEEPNDEGRAWSIPHDPAEVPGGAGMQVTAREEKIRTIVGMGFDRDRADAMLARHNDVLQEAATALLDAA